MTGLYDRLRGWVGSLFGDANADEAEADADDEPRIEGSAPTVTHRDDRPLETPDPSLAAAEALASAEDGDGDAGSDTEATTGGDAGPVTIPDAEAGVEGESTPGPGPSPPAERTARSERAVGDDATEDADPGARTGTVPDEGDAGGFECAVCGTAVEDPAHSCPLCRSTEVVPATGSPEGEP